MNTCIFPPSKPIYKRVVAIPSSNFSNLPEPARTFHIALLARALAIFRVEEVAIYRHEGVSCTHIEDVLKALETPQYLRKKLTPLKPQLKYVGLVPPLAIPSHQLKGEDYQYREGLVVAKHGDILIIDIGLERPIRLKGSLNMGERVTVKKEGDIWRIVDPDSIEVYWGFRIKCFPDLRSLIDYYRSFLIIAASRKGVPLTTQILSSIIGNLSSMGASGVLFLFGSWKKGLHEIAREEGLELASISNYILNTIQCQGTRTVRTEEAVLATLSIFNIIIG
ncbi:MAG: putative RNA uridine N3 methyltransferase [Infirmifilum sp.]